MSVSKWTFMILRNSFVEAVVFIISDFTSVSQPNSLDFVDCFPFPHLLCNSLCLWLFRLFFFSGLSFILDFSIIFLGGFLFSLFSFFSSLFILYLLSDFLRNEELDWVLDEFRVFLDKILDLILFNIFNSIIL